MSTLITRQGGPAFCGIDVGTQGARCVILTEDGSQVGHGSAPIPEGRRTGPRHEQDPDGWWEALGTATRGAVTDAGDGFEIVSVAVDATSGTVLVEGPDGAPRGPALMYDDARADAQALRADRVGAPLWSQLGYRMQTSWALPKVMWLLEHAAVGSGDRVVHQSDHLVRRLVGSPVPTDTSHALKTGVDLRNASWPTSILSELGISVSVLPEVVWPGVELGRVGTAGAAATGLPVGIKVVAGMTDGCAAQIATGALSPGSWSSALGTTLVIKGSSRRLIHDRGGAIYSHRNPDGGWFPGGASSTGAGVIRREFPDAGANELEMLTDLARRETMTGGVTYALAGIGERFPFIAPQAHGFMADRVVTDAARFAALCRSIAYVERLSYDVLASLGAEVTGPTYLSGGASSNPWWNQLRTDVLGRPTRKPASVQAAAGMAILAAAPAGRLAATADHMVTIAEQYEPDVGRGADLRVGYERLVDELVDRGWLDPAIASDALAHPAGRRQGSALR